MNYRDDLEQDPPMSREEWLQEQREAARQAPDATTEDVDRLGVTAEKALGFLRKSSKRSDIGDATTDDIARFANGRPWAMAPLEVLQEMALWRLLSKEEMEAMGESMSDAPPPKASETPLLLARRWELEAMQVLANIEARCFRSEAECEMARAAHGYLLHCAGELLDVLEEPRTLDEQAERVKVLAAIRVARSDA
jgi:hypothetical protein